MRSRTRYSKQPGVYRGWWHFLAAQPFLMAISRPSRQPGVFGFWKFVAQIGNFSRESVTCQGFCPVPFPQLFRAYGGSPRQRVAAIFFVPGEWNFRDTGASVTV